MNNSMVGKFNWDWDIFRYDTLNENNVNPSVNPKSYFCFVKNRKARNSNFAQYIPPIILNYYYFV